MGRRLAPSEDFSQGWFEGGVGELKAGLLEALGDDAGAGEEGGIGHFAEEESQGEPWGGEDRGTMEGSGQGFGEFGVSNWSWGDDVDRAAHGIIVQGVVDCADAIVTADPAPVLLA